MPSGIFRLKQLSKQNFQITNRLPNTVLSPKSAEVDLFPGLPLSNSSTQPSLSSSARVQHAAAAATAAAPLALVVATGGFGFGGGGYWNFRRRS